MTNEFTVQNWMKKLVKIPNEDSFSTDWSENIFVVSDGVTRDPFEYLSNLNTVRGKAMFAYNYPRPSPAKFAADIFTRTFQEVIKSYEPQNRYEHAILEAFEEGNERIEQWNKLYMREVDYLTRDFAGCVAAGVVLNQDSVCLGFISDCGVAIFDERGRLRFKTKDEGPDRYNEEIWQDPRLKDQDWINPKARKIIRSEYRNNPQEKNSFGVLTGEESAIEYVRVSTQEIKPGEHLIVYSDGLEQTIFSEKFSEKLIQGDNAGLEKLCKTMVQTEGTLIHYRHLK